MRDILKNIANEVIFLLLAAIIRGPVYLIFGLLGYEDITDIDSERTPLGQRSSGARPSQYCGTTTSDRANLTWLLFVVNSLWQCRQ